MSVEGRVTVDDDRVLAERAWWKAIEPLIGARLFGWTGRGSASFSAPSGQTVRIPGEVCEALRAALAGSTPTADGDDLPIAEWWERYCAAERMYDDPAADDFERLLRAYVALHGSTPTADAPPNPYREHDFYNSPHKAWAEGFAAGAGSVPSVADELDGLADEIDAGEADHDTAVVLRNCARSLRGSTPTEPPDEGRAAAMLTDLRDRLSEKEAAVRRLGQTLRADGIDDALDAIGRLLLRFGDAPEPAEGTAALVRYEGTDWVLRGSWEGFSWIARTGHPRDRGLVVETRLFAAPAEGEQA